MARPLRMAVGGVVYHVLNRANQGIRLFRTQGDFGVFEDLLERAQERDPLEIFSYCLMPTHWHFVVRAPEDDGEGMTRFFKWLTGTHAQRWHAHRKSVGRGHVYQGRFKSFPVQDDGHFLTACRYVERNPLRKGLVENAGDWRWGSLGRRERGNAKQRKLLAEWPLERGDDWLSFVQTPATDDELEALRTCVKRGRPYGDLEWVEHTAHELELTSTLRSRGRPWPTLA